VWLLALLTVLVGAGGVVAFHPSGVGLPVASFSSGIRIIEGGVSRVAQPASGAVALVGSTGGASSTPVIIGGDTVSISGERIRILNIDAPESHQPHCEAELVAGLKAKERLAQLVRSGPVQITRDGQDRYRRTLARISVGGRDVGTVLVQEGLALPWQDGAAAKEARTRRWCPG
jgi:endonuclease YncB( thermonuclease family)